MAINTDTYGACASLIEASLVGMGVVKGRNCTVSGVTENDDNTVMTFSWTLEDGTVKTRQISIPHGEDGVSVTNVALGTDNKFTFTFSDGTTKTTTAVDVTTDVNRIEYATPEDASVSNVKQALDVLFANGGGILEEDLRVTATEYDGVKGKTYTAGTSIEDILRDLLIPYAKPTVNLVINPSATLYDAATSNLTSITLNAVIGKNTNDIVSVKFYAGDTVINTITTNVASGGTFNYVYTPAIPIKTTTTFKVEVFDGANTVTASKTIVFVGKSYYGTITSTVTSVTEATIKTLDNTLKNTKNLVATFTTDFGRVIYAYPKELGLLTNIRDEKNSFSYNESFQHRTMTIDGIEYYIYELIENAGFSNVELTFK